MWEKKISEEWSCKKKKPKETTTTTTTATTQQQLDMGLLPMIKPSVLVT